MPDGRARSPARLTSLLLAAALVLLGTTAHAGIADGAVQNLASATQIRSIPNPVSGLLDDGGSATEHTTVPTRAPDEGDGSAGADEPLDAHDARSTSDGPAFLGTAAWLASAGSLLLAGLAMVRLHGSPRSPTARDRSTANGPPEDPAPDAFDGGPDAPRRDAFLEAQPPTGVDGVLTVAQACVDRGDFEAASRWFETAIALRPRMTVAHFCLGLVLEELGRDEEALEAFTSAKELGGTGPAPTYRQARILARLDRSKAALSHLAEALSEEPQLRDDAAEDPAFQPLMDHPRFLAILGRL